MFIQLVKKPKKITLYILSWRLATGKYFILTCLYNEQYYNVSRVKMLYIYHY